LRCYNNINLLPTRKIAVFPNDSLQSCGNKLNYQYRKEFIQMDNDKKQQFWQRFDADTWTATVGTITAVIALVFAIQQGCEARRHNRLSVRPLLKFEEIYCPPYAVSGVLTNNSGEDMFLSVPKGVLTNTSEGQVYLVDEGALTNTSQGEQGIYLINKGLGTAIIKSFEIYVDKKKINTFGMTNEWREVFRTLLFSSQQTTSAIHVTTSTTDCQIVIPDSIQAGEKVGLFVVWPNNKSEHIPLLMEIMERVDIKIIYESMYKEEMPPLCFQINNKKRYVFDNYKLNIK
jgi:hypothetical protein